MTIFCFQFFSPKSWCHPWLLLFSQTSHPSPQGNIPRILPFSSWLLLSHKPPLSFFFLIFIYLFGLCWVFIAAHGLSLVATSGGYSLLQCASSLRWLLLLRSMAVGSWASVVVARGLSSYGLWALERRLSSCGTWAWLLCSMWDLPGPGLKPMSSA